MFSKTILSTAAAALLAGVARAETGPGFPITTSQNLTVIYGNNTVSPGGELILRPETAQRPTISSPVWWSDEKGQAPASSSWSTSMFPVTAAASN
ncbi:hypothetical protein Ptr902_14004 (mitochondrion) [Pyrenophora tritici-repentis]|nr:hypothetical protein Ptr902_14004 [Pyrenophora tritici-repentis]